MRRLQPEYTPQSINVYLKEEGDSQAFVKELEASYPGQWNITNIREVMDSTLSTFTAAVSSMTAVITAVTIVVVSLILYLVIKTLILKRKREFGILKGMGYRKSQFRYHTWVACPCILSVSPARYNPLIPGA